MVLTKKFMKKEIKILGGLILVIAPLFLIMPGMVLASWGKAAWELIKGGITILIILIGIILILMGIDELRD